MIQEKSIFHQCLTVQIGGSQLVSETTHPQVNLLGLGLGS